MTTLTSLADLGAHLPTTPRRRPVRPVRRRRSFMDVPDVDSSLYPSRAHHTARWEDSAPFIPAGTAKAAPSGDWRGVSVFGDSSHEEYENVLAHPGTYEFVPEIVDAMREDYLTRKSLTEWDCSACGAIVHTPDHLFGTPAARCTSCGA